MYDQVFTLTARYYELGIVLDLPPHELETIHKECYHNISLGLIKVVTAWLKRGSQTWQKLVEAVDNPAGGNDHALAKKIADSHHAGKN